jgi:hypothetical protein
MGQEKVGDGTMRGLLKIEIACLEDVRLPDNEEDVDLVAPYHIWDRLELRGLIVWVRYAGCCAATDNHTHPRLTTMGKLLLSLYQSSEVV